MSEWNAHWDSYLTRDETVAVKFYGDKKVYEDPKDFAYAKKCNDQDPEKHFKSGKVSQREKIREPISAAVAAAVAGIAVDQAVKALEEEKSRYVARFSGLYVGHSIILTEPRSSIAFLLRERSKIKAQCFFGCTPLSSGRNCDAGHASYASGENHTEESIRNGGNAALQAETGGTVRLIPSTSISKT